MRHVKSRIAAFLLVLPLPGLATEAQSDCTSPELAADLIACAATRHKAADARLNRVYEQLRRTLKRRAELALDERLRASQRDWLRYQRSHCELEATYEGAGGSFVSARLSECMADTTASRTKYLEALQAYFD